MAFDRGMRSKQITRLEHQLSENIKLTQQRIWTGVTRDVSYLRKIFNEIYIMRFKVKCGMFKRLANNDNN